MNTLIDETNPAQTLCNLAEACELLSAVKGEDLTERGQMGMFRLLRSMCSAIEHLEDNHTFQRRAGQ